LNVIITCDVDVLNDVEDVVVVDLAPPLGLEDVVHGASDLASLRHHIPAHAPMSHVSKVFYLKDHVSKICPTK